MTRFLGLFILVFAFGCGSKALRPVYEYNGFAQGTTFHIVYDQTAGNLDTAIDRIFREIDRSMSLYDSNSIICRVNRGRDSAITVDRYFADVFQLSNTIYTQTNGAFNPTVLPLVKYWGFAKEQYQQPEKVDSAKIDSLRRLVRFDAFSLQAQNNRFALRKTGAAKAMLDFNGIAQGYTVDVIAEYLSQKGISNFLIEVGGETFAKGVNAKNETWRIGIDKPIDDPDRRELIAIATLNNKALATSGSYRKFYIRDGIRYSHTINPKTGFPVQHSLVSVSVFAPTCAEADAYATAFMVMGVQETIAFLKTHPELQAYLIFSDSLGEWDTFMSESLKAELEILK